MSSPHVFDVTSSNFDEVVVKRSAEVPVVIDFWAEWCGPCKRLGPLLESIVDDLGGKVVLAKVNTELAPDLAEAFAIRSIPAVFAIKEGKIVDQFVGGLPEAALRNWFDRLLPSEAEIAAAQARELEPTDPAAAEERYRHALRVDPEFAPAEIGLARLLLARDETAEVRAWLARLEARGFLEPEAEQIKAELTLRDQSANVGGIDSARAAAEAAPGDLQLRFELAEALAAAHRFDEALEIALDLVERDPKGLREPARKLMLNVFQLLPAESPLAADFRRKLSSALF
ncbi:MAG: tetratricopeptide repeat protein [Isosphaeraceae bacterium]|nr:tetratricopeptide repeat protein [Isosphaeraceae bacterium]